MNGISRGFQVTKTVIFFTIKSNDVSNKTQIFNTRLHLKIYLYAGCTV